PAALVPGRHADGARADPGRARRRRVLVQPHRGRVRSRVRSPNGVLRCRLGRLAHELAVAGPADSWRGGRVVVTGRHAARRSRTRDSAVPIAARRDVSGRAILIVAGAAIGTSRSDYLSVWATRGGDGVSPAGQDFLSESADGPCVAGCASRRFIAPRSRAPISNTKGA